MNHNKNLKNCNSGRCLAGSDSHEKCLTSTNSPHGARRICKRNYGNVATSDVKAFKIMIEKMNERDIDKRFEELLSDRNLCEKRKQVLRKSKLIYKQNELIRQYRKMMRDDNIPFDKAQDIIKHLNYLLRPEVLNSPKILICMESLKVALTNNTLSWVIAFGKEGLNTVFKVLKVATKQSKNKSKFAEIQEKCLHCVLKFINNTVGLKTFLESDHGHDVVTHCIDHRKPSVATLAIKLLSALVDNEAHLLGSDKALASMTRVSKEKKCERFAPLVKCITHSPNRELWSTSLQFINALLSVTNDFDLRIHLRNEIVRNGLHDKLEQLKLEPHDDIKIQYEVFETYKEKDVDELYERFDELKMDIYNINDCFEVLKNTTLDTAAEPYLLSILQHLLFIRDDQYIKPAYYMIIEEVISQIVLHKSGLDPDFSKKRIEINLAPLLEELKEKLERT